MKNKINENNEEVIKVLSALPKGDYILTKTKNTRSGGMVEVGNSVAGSFKMVEVQGNPAVYVDNSAKDNRRLSDPSYIRTSPIVAVLDSSKTSVIFQTEGGVYQLEKLKATKK